MGPFVVKPAPAHYARPHSPKAVARALGIKITGYRSPFVAQKLFLGTQKDCVAQKRSRARALAVKIPAGSGAAREPPEGCPTRRARRAPTFLTASSTVGSYRMKEANGKKVTENGREYLVAPTADQMDSLMDESKLVRDGSKYLLL